MLGFSIGKLIVLAAVIAVVWYGFKWMGRPRTGGGGRVADDPPPSIEEMDKCDLCGTFVPAEGAQDCGRDGCPYPP